MQTNYSSQWGLSHPRVLAAFALCSAGVLLAVFSFAANSPDRARSSGANSARLANTPVPVTAVGIWEIVNSANTSVPHMLNAVTCTSATDCWAVGLFRNDSGIEQTFIEHWNGTLWTITSSPNTSATQNNSLEAVTCASGTDCWAGGTFENGSGVNQTLIERWNGTSWSVFTSANTSATQNNFLHGVTCVASGDCWAVGHYVDASGVAQTLTEHWNGAAWARVSSPNTSTRDNVLKSVSCTSTSNCKAIGYSTNAGGFKQTLTERWDGANWLLVSSPDTSAAQHNVLQSVVCVDGSTCRAVGYFINAGGFQQSLVLRWNGTIWAIVASPNTSATEHNALQGVTCTSATNCRAVGYSINAAGFQQTLTQRWNGTNWTIVSSPSTSASQHNRLAGVICVTGANCWSVGTFEDASGFEQPLIEHWDGTAWSIVNISTLQANSLKGVTCVSSSDCWAVGHHYNGGGHQQTLIEHWNGTAWSIVASPNTSLTEDNALTSVACNSASDCWAAGFSGLATETLIEHWNGTTWAIVSSPNAGKSSVLNDVTCASATECWAVGYFMDGGPLQTLIEQWDGSSWSIVASPNASINANALNGVTCAAASDCWAVGYFVNDKAATWTLTEHWDGKSWLNVDAQNPGVATENELRDVDCISSSDCWAVGRYINGGFNQTLIEHWNGSAWSVVASANNGASLDNYLNSVSCPLSDYCWAVGEFAVTGAYYPLTQQWDGEAWWVAGAATPSSINNHLSDVTCPSALECWAVGDFDGSGGPFISQTLIERFALTAPLYRRAVSRMTHAGTDFDIVLPRGDTLGVECRRDGLAIGEYTLVFTFEPTLTSVGGASVTGGIGSISSRMIDSNDAHNYIVHLSGVTNQQSIIVSLTNVNDSAGHTGGARANMAVLLGDVTGNSSVNSTDVSQTQFESGHAVTIDNFRADVTVNGSINSSDVSTVQAQSGTGL
jgi:hypothetical protein